MRVYIGFDDTDVIDSKPGTGKLARWFARELPQGWTVWGVVRQQLLVDKDIPYTSHNSSACVVIESVDALPLDEVITKAVVHLESHFTPGSDPGLCVCPEGHPALNQLISLGMHCATRIVAQKEALQAAEGVHLSGHGGTNDGIIGAAAGVGLTAQGWHGRFIEFGGLRDFPDPVPVERLKRSGMEVVSLDRDAPVPLPDDMVATNDWLRPRLLGGKAVVPVFSMGGKRWGIVGGKRQKKEGSSNGWENILQGTD